MKIYRCKRHDCTCIEYDMKPITPEQVASYKSDAAKMREIAKTDPFENTTLQARMDRLAEDWERLDPAQAVTHNMRQCNQDDHEVIRDD